MSFFYSDGIPKKEILTIIDYYTRYHEIKFIKTTTATIIIAQPQEIFSRLAIPKSVRDDNGSQFTSFGFEKFCEVKGIEIVNLPLFTT